MKRILAAAVAVIISMFSGISASVADTGALQVNIPVRFITVQGDAIRDFGTDFVFPTGTDMLRTKTGYGGGVGGGVLFPDIIGSTDIAVGGTIFADRFSIDSLRN